MLNNSEILKKKIETFKSNFYSKEPIIKFEENQFDIIAGLVFDNMIKIFKPIIKITIGSIMKITDKFLDFISQHNEMKKKISEQEAILLNTSKLNHQLSIQMKELNQKIDHLTLKNENKSLDGKDEINKIQLNENEDNKEFSITENNEIKFFQKENLRISNELFETKTKFEIIKKEMEKFQEQRSNLINKINSINDAVEDSNIVTSVFENTHNQKKINVFNTNEKKQTIDLEKEIKNIFAKS